MPFKTISPRWIWVHLQEVGVCSDNKTTIWLKSGRPENRCLAGSLNVPSFHYCSRYFLFCFLTLTLRSLFMPSEYIFGQIPWWNTLKGINKVLRLCLFLLPLNNLSPYLWPVNTEFFVGHCGHLPKSLCWLAGWLFPILAKCWSLTVDWSAREKAV